MFEKGQKITVFPSSWSAPTGCLASSYVCANPFSPSQSRPVRKWSESSKSMLFTNLGVASNKVHGSQDGFSWGESFPGRSQEQRLLSVGPEHNPDITNEQNEMFLLPSFYILTISLMFWKWINLVFQPSGSDGQVFQVISLGFVRLFFFGLHHKVRKSIH